MFFLNSKNLRRPRTSIGLFPLLIVWQKSNAACAETYFDRCPSTRSPYLSNVIKPDGTRERNGKPQQQADLDSGWLDPTIATHASWKDEISNTELNFVRSRVSRTKSEGFTNFSWMPRLRLQWCRETSADKPPASIDVTSERSSTTM